MQPESSPSAIHGAAALGKTEYYGWMGMGSHNVAQFASTFILLAALAYVLNLHALIPGDMLASVPDDRVIYYQAGWSVLCAVVVTPVAFPLIRTMRFVQIRPERRALKWTIDRRGVHWQDEMGIVGSLGWQDAKGCALSANGAQIVVKLRPFGARALPARAFGPEDAPRIVEIARARIGRSTEPEI